MTMLNTPVRFFVFDEDQLDIVECMEAEFIDAIGTISYERQTAFNHGVNQICLTKMPN